MNLSRRERLQKVKDLADSLPPKEFNDRPDRRLGVEYGDLFMIFCYEKTSYGIQPTLSISKLTVQTEHFELTESEKEDIRAVFGNPSPLEHCRVFPVRGYTRLATFGMRIGIFDHRVPAGEGVNSQAKPSDSFV